MARICNGPGHSTMNHRGQVRSTPTHNAPGHSDPDHCDRSFGVSEHFQSGEKPKTCSGNKRVVTSTI